MLSPIFRISFLRAMDSRRRKGRGHQLGKTLPVLLVALIATACSGDDADSATTATTTPTTTAGPGFGSEDALSVTDAYFLAFNAGDVDGVASLFTPDVTIDWFGGVSRTDFEMVTAFFVGQGTILAQPDCSVSAEVPGESATVLCNFETLDGIIQAVGAPPVPTRFTMGVTPDGISRLVFTYGQLDFLNAGRPLNQWMTENHPEEENLMAETTFLSWTTLEEARQAGALQAQFSQEWAAYLEANDCGYLDGC